MNTQLGLKYRWQMPSIPSDILHQVVQTFNISPAVVHTLLARGFSSREEIEQFLFGSADDVVNDPALLKDAQKAVDRIQKAIEQGERILIVGDYDVDGITSTAMMMLCLLPLDAHVNFFLPVRTRDGYGLSEKIVDRAAQNGYSVIITVDNGITAYDAIRKACDNNIDVIVTDHHQPQDPLPPAYAIVNPHQADCEYPYTSLAGVGVTFKVLSLLYRHMQKQFPEKVYELLMLGTIADVVPLTGENRYWVRHGLAWLNKANSAAIQVLRENSGIEKQALNSIDIGFGIAPQINALGRLEDPRQGVKFLIGNDMQETRLVGNTLYELNQARKRIERDIMRDVEAAIEQKTIDVDTERVIIMARENWQPGVIGLAASRLVNTYQRPVLLFHKTKKGTLQGSCRSIAAFNIFQALSESSDILDTFGGHAAAAGLSLQEHHLDTLKQRLEAKIDQELTEEDFIPSVAIDAPVQLDEMSSKLVRDMAYLEPFGHENERPVLYIADVQLNQPPRLLKEQHVKCYVVGYGTIRSVIFFGRPDIYTFLSERPKSSFDIIGYVVENQWRGKRQVEIQGIDIVERAS